MMPDPSAEKPKKLKLSKTKAELMAALRYKKEQAAKKNAEIAQKKAARVQAGRTALATSARVDELCSAVEATLDPGQHAELLGRAMHESADALGALGAVAPGEDPSDWLTRLPGGSSVAAMVAAARAVRGDEKRFTGFLKVLAESLAESGASSQAIGYITDEVASVPAAEIAAPGTLARQCESAQCLLEAEAGRLHRGLSLADAWTTVRTAGDILDGATVLLAPAMDEGRWLGDSYAGAWLCVTAGDALMARGLRRMPVGS
jgi:hypothetical protein